MNRVKSVYFRIDNSKAIFCVCGTLKNKKRNGDNHCLFEKNVQF